VPYSPLLVRPMREELSVLGFEELMTADAVEAWKGRQGASGFLVINSVCGCAAGMARPGVRHALETATKKPAHIATVFAGQDLEATARARSLFPEVPPSSPSMALFKDGELVYFLPRHRIEGRSADQVASDLKAAFEEYCG
jgi:putative YphP/YqiW family bacilliredoxin